MLVVHRESGFVAGSMGCYDSLDSFLLIVKDQCYGLIFLDSLGIQVVSTDAVIFVY